MSQLLPWWNYVLFGLFVLVMASLTWTFEDHDDDLD